MGVLAGIYGYLGAKLALGSCLVVLVLPACSRAAEGGPKRAPATGTPRLALASGYAHRASGRVVAIGDLHGDLDVARNVLRAAGAIDGADHWAGGKLVLVQTGDTIDRGNDDRAVVDLLERLRGEAAKAGGELIAMSGNHEVMNVAGDLRYVTPASAAAFEEGREQAFAPGGRYARLLSSWPVVTKVDRSVFVHGGVLAKHARYGVERLNEEAAAWMRGERALPELLMQEDSPIWTRLYSADEAGATPDACNELQSVLHALDADRMVVGHTPQTHGVSSACGGQVWRIDTGLSHFYGGPLQWLELVDGEVRVGR